MASEMSEGRILFEKEGVFIHTTVARADEDALVAGKILLVERPEGVFIEWKAAEEYEVKPSKWEAEWAVVDTVSEKGEKSQESGAVTLTAKQPKKPPERHKYIINFDIKDLKSFKRSKPNLGWSYLIFILKCGTTCPALHFHQGGTKAFIREMEKYLTIKRSPNDACLYLVREHDPAALSRSFDELQLFKEQSNDILTQFIKDPYTATWGGFSKVTNFLRDTLMVSDAPERPREEVANILQEDLEGMAINNQDEPGFEMITKTELPPRPQVKRAAPLSPQQWAKHMDTDGRVTDIDKLKNTILRGGIDASLRTEVWKFLLNYYSWDSSYKMRNEQRKSKVDDYFRMKLQWKSVTEEQERRFSVLKERKSLIDKDVTRTDRTHQFFQGEDNPNLQVLYDILMTYCMYNFDLGYVQGMSDLLAPILVVMENEVDAFWCFAGFMEFVWHNFEMSQDGMKNQLLDLNTLIKFVDPQLYNYLESHDSSNMYFCFRWLLIMFKREFGFKDVMRLWEVLWTGLPCKNLHLIICIALLDIEKNTLLDNNFGFTEILKHINDMSHTIDLEDTLKTAEGIYYQLANCKMLPEPIRDITGIGEIGGETKTSRNMLGLRVDRSREVIVSSAVDSRDNSPPSVSPVKTHLQAANSSTGTHTTHIKKTPGGAVPTVMPTSSAVVVDSSKANGHVSNSSTAGTTPDDSSIEILPDQTDMVL